MHANAEQEVNEKKKSVRHLNIKRLTVWLAVQVSNIAKK